MVVQRYVQNPLLLDGRKIDLRLYVLVVSFQPLEVYIHSLGFARVASKFYSTDPSSMSDIMAHLTNTSIQRFSDSAGSIQEKFEENGGTK